MTRYFMAGLCALALSAAHTGTAHAQEAEGKPTTGQSCFSGLNWQNCSLRADADPTTLGASKPATFAATLNNDGDDSYDIQAALKAQFVLSGETFLNLKTSLNKNTLQKKDKEQDNFKVSVGVQQGFYFGVSENYDAWVAAGSPEIWKKRSWSVLVDTDVAFNRKGIFPDRQSATCVATPSLRACGDQHLETLRLSVVAAPWSQQFQTSGVDVNGKRPETPALYMNFAPTIGLYWDDALNDDVELLSGTRADGSVLAAKVGGTFSISPGVFENKWELVLSAHLIEALSRSDGRKQDFERQSRQFSASINYALGETFVGQKTENTFLPVLSLTYINGSDALKGDASKDTLVLGFGVKY